MIDDRRGRASRLLLRYSQFAKLGFRFVDVFYPILYNLLETESRWISILENRRIARQFCAFGKYSSVIKPIQLMGVEYVRIEENVWVGAYSRWGIVQAPGFDAPQVIIGRESNIGEFFFITAEHRIEIGANAMFAPKVFISDSNHGFEDPTVPIMKQEDVSKGPVFIGEGVWLGYGSVVLSGVRIGRNSVIGANSVVTKDVPPLCVAVGVPAAIVKRYDLEQKKWIRVGGSSHICSNSIS